MQIRVAILEDPGPGATERVDRLRRERAHERIGEAENFTSTGPDARWAHRIPPTTTITGCTCRWKCRRLIPNASAAPLFATTQGRERLLSGADAASLRPLLGRVAIYGKEDGAAELAPQLVGLAYRREVGAADHGVPVRRGAELARPAARRSDTP